MRHLFALELQLQVGLLLRADIKSDADRFQKISVLVRQTAPTHDDPARPSIGEDEAVLALESSVRGAGLIISRLDRRSFVRMDAGKNQVAGHRLVGIETIDHASLFAHPGGVLLRIQNPKGQIGRFCGETYARFALAQCLLLLLAFDGNASNVGGDLSQPRFLGPRSSLFLAIHRERTQDLTFRRQNRSRPAGAQSANLRQSAIISPERIGQHIGYHHRPAGIHGGTAGTVTRSDRGAINRFDISFGQIWRCAVTNTFAVTIQKEDGAAQSFGLLFHEKNKAGQNVRQATRRPRSFPARGFARLERIPLL